MTTSLRSDMHAERGQPSSSQASHSHRHTSPAPRKAFECNSIERICNHTMLHESNFVTAAQLQNTFRDREARILLRLSNEASAEG